MKLAKFLGFALVLLACWVGLFVLIGKFAPQAWRTPLYLVVAFGYPVLSRKILMLLGIDIPGGIQGEIGMDMSSDGSGGDAGSGDAGAGGDGGGGGDGD